jgi:hypothetical protein
MFGRTKLSTHLAGSSPLGTNASSSQESPATSPQAMHASLPANQAAASKSVPQWQQFKVSNMAASFGLSESGLEIARKVGIPEGAKASLLDLRSMRTLNEAYSLYAINPASHDALTNLEKAVSSDWATLMRHQAELAESSPLSSSIPQISITHNGITHNIMGVAHTHAAGARYFTMLVEQIRTKPFWSNEHMLGREFLPNLNSVEVMDHSFDGVWKQSWDLIKSLYTFTKPYKTLKQKMAASQALLKELEAINAQPSALDKKNAPRNPIECIANMPMDAPASLPTNVALLIAEVAGEFDSCQKRSAFQAGFLSVWDPQNTIKVPAEIKAASPYSEEAWKEKNILVGGAHGHEIELILDRVPVGLEKYFARGAKTAEIYNQSPEQYYKLEYLRQLKVTLITMAANTATGSAAAIAILEIIAALTK